MVGRSGRAILGAAILVELVFGRVGLDRGAVSTLVIRLLGPPAIEREAGVVTPPRPFGARGASAPATPRRCFAQRTVARAMSRAVRR
jgi:hypothetical protein